MWRLLFWLFLLALGHIVTDFCFYSVHRWVLHGPLGRLPGLQALKMQHAHHHAAPRKIGGFLFTPAANIALVLLGIIFVFVLPPFGLGYASYLVFYSWRHGKAHMGGEDPVSDHHLIHHMISPRWNFDIVYPLTDFIFGTYLEDTSKKRNDDWSNT